jgi:uncharacterized membrane protein
MKISTHVRAALTAAIIAGVVYFVKQPQAVAWIMGHQWVSDLMGATGVGYGVYVSYANQKGSTESS